MTVSKRSVLLDGKPFSYELQYKRVKNVNLRIRSDGSVYVSANKKVPVSFIDSFVTSRALSRMAPTPTSTPGTPRPSASPSFLQ